MPIGLFLENIFLDKVQRPPAVEATAFKKLWPEVSLINVIPSK
jgi:hypothetical protein